MKQILVLERQELQSLKDGKTLTLNLPSEDAVQLIYENGKMPKAGAGADISEENGKRRFGLGEKTKLILELLAKEKDWISMGDLAGKIGVPINRIGGTILYLNQSGRIEKKNVGKVFSNGKRRALWRIKK